MELISQYFQPTSYQPGTGNFPLFKLSKGLDSNEYSIKFKYLSGMLERYGTVNERPREVEHPGCRIDKNKLLEDKLSDGLPLDAMVDAIDKFYSNRKNLVIPIVFAYCYSIKYFAGVSKEELNSYREKLLAFSGE